MATFLRSIVFVLCAGLFALGLSYAFPGSFRVERSIAINAAADAVFARVGDLAAWESWTSWAQNDPEMTVAISDPSTGVGASRRWDGPESGRGSLTITGFDPPERLGYELALDDLGLDANGAIVVQPAEAGVRVTWVAEGELGLNPVMRWFGLFLDRSMGGDFEAGLKRLKRVCESPQP